MRHLGHRLLTAALCFLALFTWSSSVQVVRAAPTVVYDDTLAVGWINYSWADVELRATRTVHSGDVSVGVTFAKPYGAFSIAHPGISTVGMTTLRFFINGSWHGGQQLRVAATRSTDPAGTRGPGVIISPPLIDTWVEVQIPLDQLGASDTLLTGLTWQDLGVGNQQILFIDDIALTSGESPDAPQLSLPTMVPNAMPAGSLALAAVTLRVTDPQGAADVAQVTLDGRPIGLGAIPLYDDGRSQDGRRNDGVYGTTFRVAPAAPPGESMLTVTARDQAGNSASINIGAFVVLAPPGRPVALPPGLQPIPAMPQRLGFGTNQWAVDSRLDWQVQSGVPWHFSYQYLPYDAFANGWADNFMTTFLPRTWSRDTIPVVTVYMMKNVPPATGEGGAAYAQKLRYPETVQTYLDCLKRAATLARGDKLVIFQLEPDFYGYMQQLSNDPVNRPVGVKPNDPSSFFVALNTPGYPNTLAGFGQRMVDLIHAAAPNALVAPHVSMWALRRDPQVGTSQDAVDIAEAGAAFINAMGGDRADLAFVEWSDADAGSGLRPWWDDTNLILPRPSRAILWENALSVALNKRLILWQVPVGNMTLDNTVKHYRDNRAAYIFNHQSDLIDAGVIGVLFGSGTAQMTEPSTDGGVLARSAAQAYAAPATPSGLAMLTTTASGATFGWAANTESDLAGYQLRYQAVDGGALQVFDISRATSASVTLPPGVYRISIVAYDALHNLSAPTDALLFTSAVPTTLTPTPLSAQPTPYVPTPTPRATPTLRPGETAQPTIPPQPGQTMQPAPSPNVTPRLFLPALWQE